MKIIDYATNGATGYANETVRENGILNKTADLLSSALSEHGNHNDSSNSSTEEPNEPTPPVTNDPIDFGSLTDEEKEAMIGQYVEYTPITGTFNEHVGTEYNGYTGTTKNSTLSTSKELKWRILFIEDNMLTLISEKATSKNFGLGGANGYNNAVLLLNNACKMMYSNNSLGATGRSVNIEDIERCMTYDKSTDSNYGQEISPTNKRYPNIYKDEITGAPTGVYGTKYDLSDQDEYVKDTSIGGDSFIGKWTYYKFKMSTTTMNKQIYVELFSSSPTSWVASRCVRMFSVMGAFHVFYVSNTTVDAFGVYDSVGNVGSDIYGIRPVVEIDLSKVNVGQTGTGEENDGYSLTQK